MRRALLVLLGLSAGAAQAFEMEAGFSYERLDKAKPDWKTAYLEAAHTLAPRQTLYAVLREVERFDRRDTELGGGYFHPFGPSFGGQLEASGSPQHNVLPASSVFGQLSWIAGSGWVVSGGARYNEYTDTHARVLSGVLERYFGGYRAFYGVYNGRPAGGGSASAHRLGLDRYYGGERSRIGAAVTFGREVENVGPPTGVITSDVRALAVLGRHRFAPGWALTWEAGTHKQGDLYRRTGVRLGLRHYF